MSMQALHGAFFAEAILESRVRSASLAPSATSFVAWHTVDLVPRPAGGVFSLTS